MPIMYTSIYINTTTLVEYTIPDTQGNFINISNNIIKQINSNKHSNDTTNDTTINNNNSGDNIIQNTYIYDNYMFHILQQQHNEYNTLYILCMTSLQYNTNTAYNYIQLIKNKFLSQYEFIDILSMSQYNCQRQFENVISNSVQQYNEQHGDSGNNKLNNINNQVDSVRTIMTQNIDSLLERGDHIDILVTKSDMLTEEGVKFKKATKQAKYKYYYQYIKTYLALAVVVIALIYVLLAVGCGGALLPNCC